MLQILFVVSALSVGVLAQYEHHIDLLWNAINTDQNHALDKAELADFFRMHFGDTAVIGITADKFIAKWMEYLGDDYAIAQYWFNVLDQKRDFIVTSLDLSDFFARVDYDSNHELTKPDEWDMELGKIYAGAP